MSQSFGCQVSIRGEQLHIQIEAERGDNRSYGGAYDLPANDFVKATLPATTNALKSNASCKNDYHPATLTADKDGITIGLTGDGGKVEWVYDRCVIGNDVWARIVAGLAVMFLLDAPPCF